MTEKCQDKFEELTEESYFSKKMSQIMFQMMRNKIRGHNNSC